MSCLARASAKNSLSLVLSSVRMSVPLMTDGGPSGLFLVAHKSNLLSFSMQFFTASSWLGVRSPGGLGRFDRLLEQLDLFRIILLQLFHVPNQIHLFAFGQILKVVQ